MEEVAHITDHNIVYLLGNPIKNDIVSDMVCVYGRLDKKKHQSRLFVAVLRSRLV
jgi:hypothetical protein